ncbi:metal-dependent hydrolase [Thermosulfurimonas sp. F29]|uniref:metal-dependent hydrolase n=1 Tax=Thermosulfurimonas sp. F29 TaxID=2867247 RepID=UPI001C82AA32|nr:metal-dependent hydrolase [Thermosulfurimonas sp. F29]MBX6423400.1 metal-dependent hydrolase [Thermosulfurimonas sp. F29]
MQWRNHLHTGFTVGWAVFGNPVAAALAAWGALLPDKLAFGFRRHRDWTHSPLIWLALFLLMRKTAALFDVPPEAVRLALAVPLGALVHVLCDALSRAGVPLLPPGILWIGIPLYRTWDWTEEVVAALVSGAALATVFAGLL